MLPIAVLISGTGSNLRAIHAAIEGGACKARIVAVVSDRKSAKGLAFARECGLEHGVVPMRDYADRDAWNRGLADALEGFEPALVVLAGFMRIVSPEVIARFPHRIINVHPSLLPAFPGTDAPAQAIAAGVRLSGCTVHVVDAGVDTGPVLAQGAVRVHPDDTSASLHARIQRVEHALVPRVIDQVARGTLELGPNPRWHVNDPGDDMFVSPAVLA